MVDPKHVDIRVVERYIRKGRLHRDAYQQHLDALPDLAADAVEVDYDGLLRQEEVAPVLPRVAPGAGTPILTGGSAAGPLPPLPISRG